MNREDQILDWIRRGLQRYSKDLFGYKVVLFGSRVSRNHRQNSDFDLGIYGEQPISQQTFYRIGDFLDSLPTLYRIDWVDLNRASEKLRASALERAEVLYG
jgi:predicted nucleotidyltransferase